MNEKLKKTEGAGVIIIQNEVEISEILRQLQDGHIPISVLGKHNAGKSTLINALIGDRYDALYL